jgi:hypothetical protein
MSSRIPSILLIIFLVLISFFFWNIFRPSPETRAIKAYYKLEKAFEKQSMPQLHLRLHKDFKVKSIGNKKETLQYCYAFLFSQVETLKVSSKVKVLSSDDDLITLGIEVSLSGTNNDGARWKGISEGGQPHTFTLHVENMNGKWIPTQLIPGEDVMRLIQ